MFPCMCRRLALLCEVLVTSLQIGQELAAVDIPAFQPKQNVTIATDDSADGKVAVSNGVDDQRAIELLVEKLEVTPPSFLHFPWLVLSAQCTCSP